MYDLEFFMISALKIIEKYLSASVGRNEFIISIWLSTLRAQFEVLNNPDDNLLTTCRPQSGIVIDHEFEFLFFAFHFQFGF